MAAIHAPGTSRAAQREAHPLPRGRVSSPNLCAAHTSGAGGWAWVRCTDHHKVPLGSMKPLPTNAPPSPWNLPRPAKLNLALTQGHGGLRRTAQATWPYLKPKHYSKTIIYPCNAPGTAAFPFQTPHPVFPRRLHRPGQALNDSRCHCNFYQALFLVKSLFVSERCDLAFFLPLLYSLVNIPLPRAPGAAR